MLKYTGTVNGKPVYQAPAVVARELLGKSPAEQEEIMARCMAAHNVERMICVFGKGQIVYCSK